MKFCFQTWYASQQNFQCWAIITTEFHPQPYRVSAGSMPFAQVCSRIQILAADVHKIFVSGRSVTNKNIKSYYSSMSLLPSHMKNWPQVFNKYLIKRTFLYFSCLCLFLVYFSLCNTCDFSVDRIRVRVATHFWVQTARCLWRPVRAGVQDKGQVLLGPTDSGNYVLSHFVHSNIKQ